LLSPLHGFHYCLLGTWMLPLFRSDWMSPPKHVICLLVCLMCPCNNAPAGSRLQASLPSSLIYTPLSPAEVRAVQTHWDSACQCSLQTDCNHGNANLWPEAACTFKESWSLKTNRWVGNNVIDVIVALLNTRQTELHLHKHDPVFFLNSCFYSLLQG